MNPSTRIEEEAADWVARRCGSLSAEDEARFQAWLQADPQHVAHFAEMESALKAVAFPASIGLGHVALSELNRRSQRRRRTLLSLAAAACAVVGIGWFSFLGHDSRLTTAHTQRESGDTRTASSIVSRPDRQVLPDGTVVELNAGAHIEVTYTEDVRGVQLLGGEALFTVKKDAQRPFVVTAGDVAVRAVGTAFSVHYGVSEVAVLVTEGRVVVNAGGELASPGAGPGGNPPTELDTPEAAAVQLGANFRVSVPLSSGDILKQSDVIRVSPEERAERLAWRDCRIEFTSTPLTEAVAMFNRENAFEIILADAGLEKIRLSGIFWMNDPHAFIRLLESGFGVVSERDSRGIVLRRR